MNPLHAEEEVLRKRVAELAGEEGGLPAELIERWAQVRRDVASHLCRLPVEEAQRFLGAELEAVAREIERLEDGEGATGADGLQSAVELGMRLRWALWLGDILSREITVDPLDLLEEELDRLEMRCREALRSDLGAASSLAAVLERLRRERASLEAARLDRALRPEERPAGPSPLERLISSWHWISESYAIEGRCVERAGTVGGAAGRLADLRARREEHLKACAEEFALLSGEDAAEFVHAASSDLVEDVLGSLSGSPDAGAGERLQVLQLCRERLEVARDLVGARAKALSRSQTLSAAPRHRLRRDLRGLSRAWRRVRAAEEDAGVDERLVRAFGRRPLESFETLVMVLVFAFLGLLFVDWRLGADSRWATGFWATDPTFGALTAVLTHRVVDSFNVVDLVFCVVFQLDFLVRWAFSGWSRSYFRRHFLLESLPALPYGLFLAHAQAVIAARLLRLRALLRLRGAVVFVLRFVRALLFLVRGVDRAVERMRPLLDRDVVVFDPNPLGDAPESPARRRALGLEARRQHLLRNLSTELPHELSPAALRRIGAILGAEGRACTRIDLAYSPGGAARREEVHLERLIHVFLNCDVARIVGALGRDGVQRLARWLRLLDLPLLRRLPVLRRLVRAARDLNPAEAVSAAANALGEVLQEVLGVFRFWGDVSGITTGPQILDRVATAIITASKRPAVRLLFIGGLFALAEGLAAALQLELLRGITEWLLRLLGLPIVILGGVCAVVCGIGIWFKRIAGEALGQYLRVADAQFYPLLKHLKARRREDDLAALWRSVLLPECRLRGDPTVREAEWLEFLGEPLALESTASPPDLSLTDPRLAVFAEDRELVLLLYRDFLDGAVLHRSDDKTADQLLGNLTIQEVRTQAMGMGVRERRQLEKLDLERVRFFSLGPSFWFRFITESLAIETAKLVMEYNACCIRLDELELASPEARERFDGFLAERQKRDAASWRLEGSRQLSLGQSLNTASFTALDFLGPTPQSDEAVRQRFGAEVLETLKKDRRGVLRDIFGTRPYHLLPRSQRVFNPYRLYSKYLGGAKVFLLPLMLAIASLRFSLLGLRQVGELVKEVLGRKRVLRIHRSRVAGFDVAVRKINRMRKPYFMEALRLRAAVDLEYLDLRLPGSRRDDTAVSYQEDLDFIGALEVERKPIAAARRSALVHLRALRSFLAEKGWLGAGLDALLGSWDPSGRLLECRGEVLRGLATAYVTNHLGLRSTLTAPDFLRRFVAEAVAAAPPRFLRRVEDFVASCVLGFLPRIRKRRRLLRELTAVSEDVAALGPEARRLLFHRLLDAGREAEAMLELALGILRQRARGGEDPVLGAVRREALGFRQWRRRIVLVRAVQALTVLDIRSYRSMVYEVGGYEEEGKG